MTVMPGLDPGIHVFLLSQNVDGRGKPGHDKARQYGDRPISAR